MKLNKIVLIALSVVAIAFAGSDDAKVSANFRNLDIKDFIEMISKITNKNILIDTPLQGKVDFITTKKISKKTLIPLANSILSSKGYALIDKGDFMQVVKASEAVGKGLDVSDDISGDTLRTVLFKLKTSNAAVIRAKIRPLLGKYSKAVSFRNNNVLAVTAYPSTLRSIKKIIDSVEGAGFKGSTVIKLKNANVKSVYPNILKMAGELFPRTIPSEKVDVLKDESTNSIILIGKKDNVDRMLEYVKQLDVAGDDVEQKMYVIRLKNSNVEDMEKILSKLLSQMNSMSSIGTKKGGKPPKKAMVVSDVERNALIVLATGDQIKNIRKVIKTIDVEKSQVYIVAKIVEVDMGKAQQIGVKYGFAFGGVLGGKGLFSTSGTTGAGVNQLPQGFTNFLDNNGSGLRIMGNKLLALGARIDLLKQHGAAHVLSEPSVLCTNNKKSKIYVGQVRSILTSSTSGDNKNDVVRNNYSREDIGITLEVKPRISSQNKVELAVNANIEDVDQSSGSADRPTTTKREVNTNAIVNNGETIILGGLMKTSGYDSVQKVPILGDIPIIGSLFRTKGKNVSNINVVVYLTPYIIKRSSDLVKLKEFLSKLNSIQQQYDDFIMGKIKQKSSQENIEHNTHSSLAHDALEALGFKKGHNDNGIQRGATRLPQSTKTYGGNEYYRVRYGDTLYSIARRYGVDVNELKSINGLGRNPVIKTGQKLLIPHFSNDLDL